MFWIKHTDTSRHKKAANHWQFLFVFFEQAKQSKTKKNKAKSKQIYLSLKLN